MNRLGMWSARSLVAVGAIYAITLAIGVAITGVAAPIQDPVLAIMELLTLVSAPLLILLMASIHTSASTAHKAYSLAALAFMILVAGLTSVVHFVGLTALRQAHSAGIVWPSPLYAVELFAWDVFLGLFLLCAAPVFQGDGLRRAVRTALVITGSLCIVGTIGPVTGKMQFQFIAVAGYGVLLPASCFLLAREFQRAQAA